MFWLYAVSYIIISLLVVHNINAITSPLQPFTTYKYSTELQADVADLWWTVNETQQDITFELHIKTTGWIALGISPAGGMKGADIGLGWIDQTSQLHFQDRYAYSTTRPVIDSTTTDWFPLQGREQNGWTAIQFKRLLDTCDTMDVAIKSGTNILIFAYGLEDPDMSAPEGIINYHNTRRGSRRIPLQSYNNPSSEDDFADLDYFDFQLNEYIIPATDTTYHCKVYKAPTNITERRHAIAHKTIIDPINRDIVHHLQLYECDPTTVFDDNNLPEGVCDDINLEITPCATNLATTWAVGGDVLVEFPKIAGYPVGGDFEIKYYMIQMHYDNPKLTSNRRDSSGIRFYLGKELRQYDLGYLTLGTADTPYGIAIPPGADQFIIDSYCPASATKNFPNSGITVLSAFPHTHLQGYSVWTKIIRNQTAVDYLFNGEAYDFNYQYENTLSKPIVLHPGDELATRCIYRTTNKAEITLGGEKTSEEMCLHMFVYYPRMSNLYACLTMNSEEAWMNIMNGSVVSIYSEEFRKWLLELQWTSSSIVEWQAFFNNASGLLLHGAAGDLIIEDLPELPKYEDLKSSECKRFILNSALTQTSFVLLIFIPFVITILLK